MCGVAAAYFVAETYYRNQREVLSIVSCSVITETKGKCFQLFPALFLPSSHFSKRVFFSIEVLALHGPLCWSVEEKRNNLFHLNGVVEHNRFIARANAACLSREAFIAKDSKIVGFNSCYSGSSDCSHSNGIVGANFGCIVASYNKTVLFSLNS
jgi:hypothetical protein